MTKSIPWKILTLRRSLQALEKKPNNISYIKRHYQIMVFAFVVVSGGGVVVFLIVGMVFFVSHMLSVT